MNSDQVSRLENLTKEWNDALTKRDYIRGLKAAVAGYEYGRSAGSREYCLMFLGFLRHGAEALFDEHAIHERQIPTSHTCSFCLREMPTLVRGTGVAICSECIDEARTSLVKG